MDVDGEIYSYAFAVEVAIIKFWFLFASYFCLTNVQVQVVPLMVFHLRFLVWETLRPLPRSLSHAGEG